MSTELSVALPLCFVEELIDRRLMREIRVCELVFENIRRLVTCDGGLYVEEYALSQRGSFVEDARQRGMRVAAAILHESEIIKSAERVPHGPWKTACCVAAPSGLL